MSESQGHTYLKGHTLTADALLLDLNEQADAVLEEARLASTSHAARTLVNVHGEARVAYDVFVDKGGAEWYETLVDANTGELLYRRNLYCDAHGLAFCPRLGACPEPGLKPQAQVRQDVG